jgi:tRNA1(Val) A37 N6-methylase TrmN6
MIIKKTTVNYYTRMTEAKRDLVLITILNKKLALRKLLCNQAFHEQMSAISKDELTPEKEPYIRQQLEGLAKQIAASPETILIDTYSDKERAADWKALLKKEVLTENDNGKTIVAIDTRTRPGHKILDHHMPHFYDVKNYKGKSVRELCSQPAALEKALLTNVMMHTTPYKSEIRRMLTMTSGCGHVTKYRTVTAKAIIQFFGAKQVLDPCAGWGGRMLGCLAAGEDTYYVGCEPDPHTSDGLANILADNAVISPDIRARARALIMPQPAEVALDHIKQIRKFDMVLTSPPYFNLELYTTGEQSTTNYKTWEEWKDNWLKPVILKSLACLKENGVSCWSVKNFKSDKSYPLEDVTKQIHEEAGWKLVKTVSMTGSARPGGGDRVDQAGKEKRKSEEETFCFRKA